MKDKNSNSKKVEEIDKIIEDFEGEMSRLRKEQEEVLSNFRSKLEEKKLEKIIKKL